MGSKITDIVIILLVLIIVLLGLYFESNDETDAYSPWEGHPVVATAELKLEQADISQILNDGRYLYVLYDAVDEYVQVYDLDGSYQFTISVFCHPNGALRMALVAGDLYICDRYKNIYIFHGDIFKHFIDAEDARKNYSTIDFECWSKDYKVRSGSVWNVSNEGEVCVIDRSAAYSANQVTMVFMGCFVILFILMRFWGQKRFKH